MKVLFRYQYVLEVIKNNVTPLVKGATVAQRTLQEEEKIKDYKALYLIHQCVDVENFEKVGDCTSLKETWEILDESYA